jgi:ubiquinone/menaquinone biosynthesis C-methylase UbiE
MKSNLKHGDFTGLAKNYSKFRPAYSDSAVTAVLSLVGKKTQDIDFADVGAGTGIWTRLIDSRGTKSSTAVEPNDDMRGEGVNDSNGLKIKWQKGSGEATGLADNSADFLSMASSFHWVDFEKGT